MKIAKILLLFLLLLSLSKILLGQQFTSDLSQKRSTVGFRTFLNINQDFPLDVSAVTAVAPGVVKNLRLNLTDNFRERTITEVKIGWIITDAATNQIINAGQSKTIKLDTKDPQTNKLIVSKSSFPFNDFAQVRLLKEKLKQGVNVDFLVSYVKFAEGKSWKFRFPANSNKFQPSIQVNLNEVCSKGCRELVVLEISD